jgi:SNF2 family DNA or RNA helicase
MLTLIAEQLNILDLPFLSLTGKTPPSQRGAVVTQFQHKTAPIFLISLKAGGVGLNLTAADTVIHMDPWWNPAVEEQATSRAHRIGQEQAVFVYKLVVEGSIEERILELQARKAALAEGVLGSDAALAPKFNAADLQALLAPLGV